MRAAGWRLVNADCVLVGEEPRIAAAPRRDAAAAVGRGRRGRGERPRDDDRPARLHRPRRGPRGPRGRAARAPLTRARTLRSTATTCDDRSARATCGIDSSPAHIGGDDCARLYGELLASRPLAQRSGCRLLALPAPSVAHDAELSDRAGSDRRGALRAAGRRPAVLDVKYSRRALARRPSRRGDVVAAHRAASIALLDDVGRRRTVVPPWSGEARRRFSASSRGLRAATAARTLGAASSDRVTATWSTAAHAIGVLDAVDR